MSNSEVLEHDATNTTNNAKTAHLALASNLLFIIKDLVGLDFCKCTIFNDKMQIGNDKVKHFVVVSS